MARAASGAGGEEARRESGHKSLFGEILDWMLLPLVFIWPMSIALTNIVASDIADEPYDQTLRENLKSIARLVRTSGGSVQIDFPTAARDILRQDELDTIYYQVLGPTGELVLGDRDIPVAAPPHAMQLDSIYLRDDQIKGEDIRIAYKYLGLSTRGKGAYALVQVAETKEKRRALTSRIVSGVLFPQFAVIPLAVLLVYIGLNRGLAPLDYLKRLIERRRPGDLSPIRPTGVPHEVQPLIASFNDMMHRLEQNLAAQQRFIADAAHQMRTPLTGLKMQSDLALAESDPVELRESLKRISESADRAAHLINQLLVLARAEASSEKDYQVEPVDLETLLTDLSRDFVPRAVAKRIDFGIERTDWPLVIDGNPLQLREMFKNLIDNAIKYTAAGGRVTVRTRAGEFAVVEVEDDGIGIAASERELVFERFYRSLDSSEPGSGLGLAIVREIADLHRGNVLLKPNPNGYGTLVEVVFPRQQAQTGTLDRTRREAVAPGSA